MTFWVCGRPQKSTLSPPNIPTSFPNLSTLAMDEFWLSAPNLPASAEFFTTCNFTALTHLKLNFIPGYGVHRTFWHAFLRHAHDPHFLPQLTQVSLVDAPISAVQDLVLLRQHAHQAITDVTLHFPYDFPMLNMPRQKEWLIKNTAQLGLTYGGRAPWAQGSGVMQHRSDLMQVGIEG
ncbi:hypothetical protein B0H10DRAFT_1954813 [Mycena sp. CBHHK59/15]|nr:hypothetical protein B0H10DRAFT_1954813 [Mycena sp. CBHHK59/15]